MDREILKQRVATLHRQHGAVVRRRAAALLGRSDAAEDVVQEVFVRVMENLPGFRAEASPVTWLYRITTNLCVDRLRRYARRHDVELTPQLLSSLGSSEASAERRLGSRQQIIRLLQRSDAQTIQIFIHSFVDGMSQEEIAAAVGVSRKTVWTRLDRLRKRLEASTEGARA